MSLRVNHHCHAHACTALVAPSLLMCRAHWAMVPNELRFPLLRAHRAGQCRDKRPSAAYLAAQRACVAHVARAEGHNKAADYYDAMAATWRAKAAAGDEP